MYVNYTKENKKVAILSYGTRISLKSKNVRSVDFCYLREILQNVYGRTVDFVDLKTKKEDDIDYFKNLADTDLNDYDEVMIYNCTLNPFGGVFKTAAIQTFQKLFDFKGDIWYFLVDPKMPCTDFGKFLEGRIVDNKVKTDNKEGFIEVTPEFCKEWSAKVYPKIKMAFGGRNYDLYYKTYTDKLFKGKKEPNPKNVLNPNYDWTFIPLFEYYAVNENLEDKLKNFSFTDKKYDLIYFGNNRMTERNKIIEKMYDVKGYNNYILGYDPEFKNCEYKTDGYVSHDEMFKLIPESSFATLVLGDVLHNNNIRTPRFFEAMLLDIVAFIYDAYDSDRTLVNSEFLKSFIYVSTPEELKDKLEKIKNNQELYKQIVELEREEVISQFGQFKMTE